MTDQLYYPPINQTSLLKDKGAQFFDKQLSPFSTGFMSPQNFRSPNSTQSKYNSLKQSEKQKQNLSLQHKDEVIQKKSLKGHNKSFSSRSFQYPFINNTNSSLKFEKTIFEMAEHEVDQKIKTQQKSSKSLSIQKYKELISNTSPTTIHLPAQRAGQYKITEFQHQDLNNTIRDGFTSFYQIKTQNQDYLINLHQSRKSVNDLVDLGDLEVQRQFAKKKEQKQEPQKQQKKQNPTDFVLQYQYENKDHIQLELGHNKAMLNTFVSNHEQRQIKLFKEAYAEQINSDQKSLKMPPIRKYPMQRKKETHNIQLPKDEIELDQKLQEDQRKLQEEMRAQVQGYKVYFYTIPQNDWKPNAREGASLVIDKNKAYLFGGMGIDIFNSIEVLDLEQNLKWKTFEHSSAKNNIPTPRFGHSMNYHKGNLIVFGGETHFNTNFKQRQCLLDIYLLSIEQKKWTFVNVSGDMPCGRRCHTASIVGRWLIAHGGSNFRDMTLSDLWAFDLGTSSWQELSTVCQDMTKNKYTATGHSSCSVFYSSRQNKLLLFKYVDVKVPKWIPQIKYEGVYYFGGKDEEGNVSNTLRILKTDQNPLSWIFPEVYGQSPQARYGHSMTFNQLLNIVVICGGKNDDEYLNDIHILHLENLHWLKVDITGAQPAPRSCHSAVSYDSKLVIFGGLNNNGYLSSQIQMIELDENLSKQNLVKDQQKQKFILEERLKMQNQQLMKEQLKKEKAKLLQHEKRKSLDVGGLYYYNDHNNYDYGDIPFSSKLIQEQDENQAVKQQIEKLNFNNFISFLPLPNKAKVGSRLQHQRTLSQFIAKKTPKSTINSSNYSNFSDKGDKTNKVDKGDKTNMADKGDKNGKSGDKSNKADNGQKSEENNKADLKGIISPSKILLQKTVNKILRNLKHE